MRKFVFSCFLLGLVFIGDLSVLFSSGGGIMEGERRMRAAFPSFPDSMNAHSLKIYAKQIRSFCEDNFPLRDLFVKGSAGLYHVFGDNLSMDKCYKGKDGWLFLGNSFDRCVDKLAGRYVLTGDTLRKKTDRYREIAAFAQGQGAEFLLFLAPEKSSIYPEYLPPVVIPSGRRYPSPLIASLRQRDVSVFDPTDVLLSGKERRLLYYATDTHWNAAGAFLAFNAFRLFQGLSAVPEPVFTELPSYHGDLLGIGGYGDSPFQGSDTFKAIWAEPPVPEKAIVWVFGDSMLDALKPYFSASYAEVRFFRHEEFPAAFSAQAERPQVVIWEVTERNF